MSEFLGGTLILTLTYEREQLIDFKAWKNQLSSLAWFATISKEESDLPKLQSELMWHFPEQKSY